MGWRRGLGEHLPGTWLAWRLGPAVLPWLVALALVAYPFGLLVSQAAWLGPGEWLAVLDLPPVRQALAHTLAVSAAASILGTALGAALALGLRSGHLPGRQAIQGSILLPILVPPFVDAFGWVQAYGPAGLLDSLLHVRLPGLYGPVGVTLLLVSHGAPIAYLACAAALSGRGAPDLERAARASGATAWTSARTVTLPLLRPALAASAGLIFLSSASDFGIPAVVGVPGRFSTITTEIFQRLAYSASDRGFASVVILASLLAAVAIMSLALVARAGGQVTVEASHGAAGLPPSAQSRGARIASLACWTYVLIVSGLPLLAMILVALTSAYGLPQVPANWTLVHFQAAFDSQRIPALLHSLGLAAAAATLSVLLGGLVAGLPGWLGGRWLALMVAVPYAVPGSTVAVASILAFNRWWYGTLTIILVAYVGRFWALAERPLQSAISQLGRDGERAARVAGAGAVQAGWTALVPPLRSTLLATWALVFLSAFHELTVSSLLYGPRSETIAVVILSLEQEGDVAGTAALAVLLTLLVLVVALPIEFSRQTSRLAGWGS